ncbi:hypothetical protein P7H06_22405 [Paenibacillus larvae]|nr:hypothetical protein [Paenibacillus larvae]MDT2261701.1 hypothetical protein [Paenibacillus larvae]
MPLFGIFKGKSLEEGLSAEEIDQIKNHRPDPHDPMKVIEKQIKALQKALNYVLVDQEEANEGMKRVNCIPTFIIAGVTKP